MGASLRKRETMRSETKLGTDSVALRDIDKQDIESLCRWTSSTLSFAS